GWERAGVNPARGTAQLCVEERHQRPFALGVEFRGVALFFQLLRRGESPARSPRPLLLEAGFVFVAQAGAHESRQCEREPSSDRRQKGRNEEAFAPDGLAGRGKMRLLTNRPQPPTAQNLLPSAPVPR